MDKDLAFLDMDEALPEIESNEVELVVGDDPADDERVRAAVEEVTRRLEAELADTRGELGARIAELEGEVEALRETEADHLREIEDIEAGGALPQPEAGANSTLITMLHAELSAAQTAREQLAAELDEVRLDREKLQDELAAQIANLAGQLAARDAELQALRREAPPAPAAELADMATRLEDLEAENEFLQAEIDRLAALVAPKAS